MIDWMNPSEDVVEAKRIGFNEGLECASNQIEELHDQLEAARAQAETFRKEAESRSQEREEAQDLMWKAIHDRDDLAAEVTRLRWWMHTLTGIILDSSEIIETRPLKFELEAVKKSNQYEDCPRDIEDRD